MGNLIQTPTLDRSDSLTLEEEQLLLSLQGMDLPVLAVIWKHMDDRSAAVLTWANACAELAGGSFTLVPVEYDGHEGLARWLGVTGVPSVLVLLHGEVVDRLEGDYGRFSHWITGTVE